MTEAAYVLIVLFLSDPAPKPTFAGEFFHKSACEMAGVTARAAADNKAIYVCIPKQQEK